MRLLVEPEPVGRVVVITPVAEWVMRCLEKKPERRFVDASELVLYLGA